MDNPQNNLSQQVQSFWAKTGDEENPAQGMSLGQHMVDSAQVAQYLWRNWISQGSKALISSTLNLSESETEAFVGWVVGTHDIGKATPEFAGQLDARANQDLLVYRQRIEDCGYVFPADLTTVQRRCPHSQYSQSIIFRWLMEQHQPEEDAAVMSIAQVSGAHHGMPAEYAETPDRGRRDEQLLDRVFRWPDQQNWAEAWDELLTFITHETGAANALQKLVAGKGLTPEVQFFLTGLTIMSDWIASNPEFFPYEESKDQQARVQAGFEALGLSRPWQPENFADLTAEEIYRTRFGWGSGVVLHPMQKVAVDAARSLAHGGLVCIEAPMGQGKTEAGLVAAEILAHNAGKNGMMFAAPTQATANALFDRIDQWAQNAASSSEVISMFLAHSKNQLNEKYNRKRFAKVQTFEPHDGEEKVKANVIAHQWFSRKKGVLSNFVVGTVDQVLMMALASRHVMLRHLGLGEKVVVIDEVHAYDAYMNVYLENSLRWLGKMQAPVILMSATLPAQARQKLMRAYAEGRAKAKGRRPKNKRTPADSPRSTEVDLPYPVIHTVSADGGAAKKWEIEQPQEQNQLSLRIIDDSFAELDRVLAPLETGGGCAAVICNTVGRAQEVYSHLQGLFPAEELMLVHSRFIALDRVAQEKILVEKLGKAANRESGRPYRFIVVGTQVIEQSLDIDFDLMITDHAPVDLILQRVGRLHRHNRNGERPPQFARPVCYVRGVKELGSSDTAPVFPDVAELIYDKALLLSSYAQLMPFFEGRDLQLPADISALVQGAYSDMPELPESWIEKWEEARSDYDGKMSSSRRKAEGYTMNPRNGKMLYDFFKGAQLGGKDSDELKAEAKVRDTDDTLEVIVVQSDDELTYRPLHNDYADRMPFDRDSPDKPDWKLANTLAASTIRLPHQFADNGKPAIANPFDKALDELERNQFSSWQKHYLLKGQLALVLDSNSECVLVGKTVHYSKELGLQVIRNDMS